MITFLVERDWEIQEVRELRVPGYSGGKMPGRREKGEKILIAGRGRATGGEGVTKAVLAADPVDSAMSGKVEETRGVQKVQAAFWLGSPFNMRVEVGIVRRWSMFWRKEV